MYKIKSILIGLLLILLVYTRFINLTWGLPYSMHPDERNMVNAIQQLKCEIGNGVFEIKNCFNPHFFAYGQFPLYSAYFGVTILKFIDGDLFTPVSYEEATLSLRILSAIASILNVIILIKIAELILRKFSTYNRNNFGKISADRLSTVKYLTAILVFTFSPFFIQFSHFGTTESLIMLFFTLIVYLALKSQSNPITKKNLFWLALIAGLALATKISTVIFLIIPVVSIIDNYYSRKDNSGFTKLLSTGVGLIYFLSLTLVFNIIFSPHNFISFADFLGAMNYESEVALGIYRAFYTRQFDFAAPIFFQFFRIFPYSLGWPVFILSLFGFILLPFKQSFNLLRLAILIGFGSSAFLYAKWTRFVSPIFPIMLVLSLIFLEYIILNIQLILKFEFFKLYLKYLRILLLCLMIIPGIAFLSIYQSTDVRFAASDWIYKNIPDKSIILFETANVVDPPFSTPNNKESTKNFALTSFNFYDLEVNPTLKTDLWKKVTEAEYFFIPSRRVIANYYCSEKFSLPDLPTVQPVSDSELLLNLDYLNPQDRCVKLIKSYPTLNEFYNKLFSGELGFMKVVEFKSFPKIELFGYKLIEFPDEAAEETWTVFDHPVFRIYKK